MMQQQQQQQQGFSGMVNQAGIGIRSPPSRSTSLPIASMRNMSLAPSLDNNGMNLQQQQLNQMQAMAGSVASGGAGGAFGSPNQASETMDASMRSVPGSNPSGIIQNMGALGSAPMGSLGMNPSMAANAAELLAAGGFDPKAIPQVQGPNGEQRPLNVNEAMEKLCESMKRSAMSRSLVKQLSGRSLSRQGSNRSLVKQGSARNLSRQNSGRQLTKQLSGRNLARANSGRSLQRSASGRALLGGVDGAASIPVRRMSQNPKHQLGSVNGPPGRGIYRHKSQSALMGRNKSNAAGTMLRIDDNQVGMF